MPSVEVVAERQVQLQARLVDAAKVAVMELWWQLPAKDPLAGWADIGPQVTARVADGQLAAARAADPYLAALATSQGITDGVPGGMVAPSRLAGVASDGRPLDTLLERPLWTVGRLMAQGMNYQDAMLAGGANLLAHTSTQIYDTARAATQVATAARPWGRWSVRVTSGRSCSRCIVLAGRRYRWDTKFRRHPGCGCSNVAFMSHETEASLPSPLDLFNRLTPIEQAQRFTAAGAEAIRRGADVAQVVNARRGMTTATMGGVPVKATTVATGRTGSFTAQRRAIDAATGQRGRGQLPRLMPEQIIQLAGGDRTEALRLLIGNGYVTAGGFAAQAARYVALGAR